MNTIPKKKTKPKSKYEKVMKIDMTFEAIKKIAVAKPAKKKGK